MRGPSTTGALADHARRAAYTLSGVLSAALVGNLLGSLGALLPMHMRWVVWLILAATASIYGYAQVRGHDLPVPQRDWIIPSEWVDHGDLFFATAFGACFGVGLLTRINHIGYHLMLGICLVTASPILATSGMALFGLVRTAPVFVLPLDAALRGRSFGYEATVHAAHCLIKLYPDLKLLQISALAAVAVTGFGQFMNAFVE